MTTIQLYHKHKAGEISRDRFLYEVRKDTNLPWVTNITSYDDAVKILKNKGIISEADANIATDPVVDRVNPYFLKKGVEKMLSKEDELTNDSYVDALNKAAKKLNDDPHAFDEEMFHNAEDVAKADAKLKMVDVKKDNHNDKANEMKKVKVKALKETLTNFLKKKELVNEDSHWKYNVGTEVHTPDGVGKVVEIVGGTLTVELEDATQKDYQLNTIDHFTQKAQERPSQTVSKAELDQMWAKWDKEGHKPFAGMVGDPEYFKKPLDLSKLKEYIAKHRNDKEKMSKLKKAIKERLDVVKGKNASTGDEEILAVVPGGQGAKTVQSLKSKGATSATVKTIA